VPYTADNAASDPGPSNDGRKDDEAPRTAKEWLEEIKQAEKDFSKYEERAKKICEIYGKTKYETATTDRKYAILWSNIEVLKPATYSRQPQPVVNRRFVDKDTTGREVSEVIQRCLQSIFDTANVDQCLRKVRDDFLLVGQGTAWVRYVPTFQDKQFGDEQVNALCSETLAFDFVHWSDFIRPKVRGWEELPWLARKVYLDRERFIARFGNKGEEALKKLKATKKYEKAAESDKNTIVTYEIWSKVHNKVVWIAKDYDKKLDEKPPLYNLHGFWPCPRPAYGTLQTDTLVPIPDYVFYQDQAEEIDDLTKKISALSDALKLVGFYPAGAEGEISTAIEKALNPLTGNQLIPVPAWAAFVQGGGAKQMVEWLPVENVSSVLSGCVELRKQLIDDVYQITGISDILRGEGEASETATAQNLKAQWGGIRIRDRQAEMARFARDITRIAAEIIAEKFQEDTIWALTGLKYQSQAVKQQLQAAQQFSQQQPQAQLPPAVQEQMKDLPKPSQEDIMALIRDDCLRSYRVDIETDSTIEANEQQEKTSRNEFLEAVTGFVDQIMPVAQQAPMLIPAFGEMLMFVVRGYRTGRSLEDEIQNAVDEMSEHAKQMAQNPPPNPKIEVEKEKLQLEDQHNQNKFGLEKQESEHRMKMAEAEHGLKIAGHNKQLIDEASQQMLSQQDDLHPGPSPVEFALQQLGQVMHVLASQGEAIKHLLAMAAAPKRAIRGPDGKIESVVPMLPAPTQTLQ
jgi:hypothetical protein